MSRLSVLGLVVLCALPVAPSARAEEAAAEPAAEGAKETPADAPAAQTPAEPAAPAAPAAAPAQPLVEAKKEEAKKDEEQHDDTPVAGSLLTNPNGAATKSGFSLVYSFSSSLSNGTFVSNFGASNPTWSQWLLLQPAYRIDKKTSVNLRTSWNYELLTKSDAENGRRFSPDDWTLSLNRTLLTEKDDGVMLLVGPRASVPVSYESRFAARYTTLSVGASVAKTFFGAHNVMFSLAGSKNLGKYTTTVVTPEEAAGGGNGGFGGVSSTGLAGGAPTSDFQSIANCRFAEKVCGGGDFLTNYSLGAILSVSGDLPIKDFSYSVMYRLGSAWKYGPDFESDPYLPKKTDVDGNPVVGTSNRGADSTFGFIGISYALNEKTTLDLQLMSAQPALRYSGSKDPSTKASWVPRFPFWDFVSPANNFSSVGIGISSSI